jgi:hypothetical protein
MGNVLRKLFGMERAPTPDEEETEEERQARLQREAERNPTNMKAGAKFAESALRKRKRMMEMADEE